MRLKYEWCGAYKGLEALEKEDFVREQRQLVAGCHHLRQRAELRNPLFRV